MSGKPDTLSQDVPDYVAVVAELLRPLPDSVGADAAVAG